MIRAVLVVLLAFPLFAATPSTIHNDDSCDIAALPAATLLLPYFEVDLDNALGQGQNTIFVVTNVTSFPQIVRVTLWTDWSYPVFSFDLFLTGYDAQTISLHDVIAGGVIAPPYGPAVEEDNRVGRRSKDNDETPLLDISRCDEMTVAIPAPILADLQSALTTGDVAGCPRRKVGGTHAGRAIGYATIDLVRNCSGAIPSDAEYFTSEILYENVLTGDYQHVDRANNHAQGGAMVHIRAIPEGGTEAEAPTFAKTFYSRHQSGGTADRRQPLPSVFAARWIDGGAAAFDTRFRIWRDRAVEALGCEVGPNARHASADVVRFDEDENPTVHTSTCIFACWPYFTQPSTSTVALSDTSLFPPNAGGDAGGWMYINLNDYEERPLASQSWLSVVMRAETRDAGWYNAPSLFTTEVDATALGNGCTPEAPHWTDRDGGSPAIAPAPRDNGPKPPGLLAMIDNDDSCDISQQPAATLLLPYFEVERSMNKTENTLFTVTNVSPLPQIAHVTLWTDRAYPVLTFDIFLTGYDVQSIDLYDVLAQGRIVRPVDARALEPGRRSAEANPVIDASTCTSLPASIPAEVLDEVQRALTVGLIQSCGTQRVGNAHTAMIGYATIDVVRDCNTTLPTDPRYYTEHLAHDNVLTGDYVQISTTNNFAQGGAMVHIRAIPDGTGATSFARTFYSRYQSGRTDDRRQPLPSTFAVHWITGGTGSFNTSLKMWREISTGSTTGCAVVGTTCEFPDLVRFDEEENATTFAPDVIITLPPRCVPQIAAARLDSRNVEWFPPNPGGDVAGWFYLNLGDHIPVDATDSAVASQSWVTVSMRNEGRFAVEFDATALGNGCSPEAPITNEDGEYPVIGPAPNQNPSYAPFDTIAPPGLPSPSLD